MQSLPEPAGAREQMLEDYLERLTAPLAESLPYPRRQEIREEVRAHLLALAEAHVELGSSSVEAMELALRQFGDPRRIGRGMRREVAGSAWVEPALTAACAALVGGACGYASGMATDVVTFVTGIERNIEYSPMRWIGLFAGIAAGTLGVRLRFPPLKQALLGSASNLAAMLLVVAFVFTFGGRKLDIRFLTEIAALMAVFTASGAMAGLASGMFNHLLLFLKPAWRRAIR